MHLNGEEDGRGGLKKRVSERQTAARGYRGRSDAAGSEKNQ